MAEHAELGSAHSPPARRTLWRWVVALLLVGTLLALHHSWENSLLAHAKAVVTEHLNREISMGRIGEAGKPYQEFAREAGPAKRIEAVRSYMQLLGTPLNAEVIVTRRRATFRELYHVNGDRLFLAGSQEVIRR